MAWLWHPRDFNRPWRTTLHSGLNLSKSKCIYFSYIKANYKYQNSNWRSYTSSTYWWWMILMQSSHGLPGQWKQLSHASIICQSYIVCLANHFQSMTYFSYVHSKSIIAGTINKEDWLKHKKNTKIGGWVTWTYKFFVLSCCEINLPINSFMLLAPPWPSWCKRCMRKK